MNGSEAPRGYRGTMIAPTTVDDESYLDFVQGLRGMAIGPLHKQAEADARAHIGALAAVGREVGDRTEIARIPSVGMRDRMMRSAQEMLWRRVSSTYDSNRAALNQVLDADEPAPGDAAVYPDYLREYHLQPGGYHTDDLAGYVYHYGTKVFWVGSNDRDQAKTEIVNSVPTPADGVVNRIVELACSVGQSTVAFKQRFPDAEVWGTDIAAPVLRYARARARRLGVDVHFARQPAEALEFEDGSVDLVFASLLFHEVPVEVGQEVVRQVARVLRPGGLLVVSDLNPGALEVDAWGEYDRWWDTFHNCEPYEYDFLQSDFSSTLRQSFTSVEFAGNGYGARWVATR
jgi:SAM-dependent methyltransferase